MSRRLLAAAAAVWLATGAVAPVAAGSRGASIAELDVRRAGTELHVGYAVRNALGDSVLERIHSGIPVTFRHRVEVVSRRTLRLWPSKTLARLRISTTVTYDALTRQYDLARRIEAHAADAARPIVTEGRRSTERLEDVEHWMTDLRELPPLRVPESARLKLRVESVIGRRYFLYMIPTDVSVSAERKLDG